MNRAGRWRRRAAVLLLALYAGAALPGALSRSWRALRNLIERRGETALEARSRVFGADYVAGIETARAAIPVTEAYLLFDAGRLEEGAANWVRYDLAPRRAVRGGPLERLGRPARVREKLRRMPNSCVVARPQAAPLVMTREGFVAWLESGGDRE